MSGRRHAVLTFFLFIGLLLTVVVASGMGYLHITPAEVLEVIVSRLTGAEADHGMNQAFPFVVMEVRLPRILTSAIVGGALAVMGVVFQAILLNPLADPYTLGISSGAAFGASLALLLNLTLLHFVSVPLFAFLGALATLAIVLYLASVDGRFASNTLILSGVIVAAILSAGIGFIKYMADEQVGVIIFWLMGSFAAKTWLDVAVTFAVTLVGVLVTFYYARDLNIMSLGTRAADSLGVDSARVRKNLLITGSLVTAVCVSVSGIIGFIGLIIPHLMRFVVGPDNRRLVPVSFFSGAMLLLAADTITRAVLPVEVPIGVLTALLGGPFFCYIFRRRQVKSHG